MKEQDLIYLVLKASSWVNDGIPLKDVMDRDEIEYAIHYLAEIFEKKGYSYNEEGE